MRRPSGDQAGPDSWTGGVLVMLSRQCALRRTVAMRASALTTDIFTEVVVAGIGHLAEDRRGSRLRSLISRDSGRPACSLTWCASTSPTS